MLISRLTDHFKFSSSVLFVVLASVFVLCDRAYPEQYPNIILITADTTRQDHLGVYGYPEETSPNLDAFSKDALVFSNAFTPVPQTTPAHRALFSAFYPIIREDERVKYKVLAEILRDNGYETAAFTSSVAVNNSYGFDKGFETYNGFPFTPETPTSRQKGVSDGESYRNHLERKAVDTTNAALSWLESGRDRQKPLFLWVHYYDPHHPYLPPARYMKDTKKDLQRWNALNTSVRPHKNTALLTEEDRALIRSLYDGEIRYMDHEIGRLFNRLKTDGLYKDSVIIFLADHGEVLGEREDHYGHHIFLYNGAIKIPLMMKMPGVRAGRPDIMIHTMDVMPSLLAYLNIKDEDEARRDGSDLFPRLSGAKDKGSPALFITSCYKFETKSKLTPWNTLCVGHREGLCTGRWKYWVDKGRQTDQRAYLYDLSADPGEKNNVIQDFPDQAEKLQRELAPYGAIMEQQLSEPPADMELIQETDEGKERIKQLKSLGYL